MTTTLVFILWLNAGASIKVIRDPDYVSFERCELIASQVIEKWKPRLPPGGAISWKCEQKT